MNKIFYFICILSLALSSCSNNDDEIETQAYTGIYGFSDVRSARNAIEDYYIYGTLTSGASATSTVKYNNTTLSNDCSSLVVFRNDLSNMGNITDGGVFTIGNNTFTHANNSYSSNNTIDCPAVYDLYGRNVSHKLERMGSIIYEDLLYSPEKLDVLIADDNTTLVDPAASHYYLDVTSSLSISYNEDLNNLNGVMVVARGDGSKVNVFPPAHPGNIEYSALLLDESAGGKLTLPATFFDKYEKDEIITLSLYRGVFDYLTPSDGYTYKNYIVSEIRQEYVIVK